ncbi:hypothetical protein ACEPAF_8213 [Sanghuangporus sanghuang]
MIITINTPERSVKPLAKFSPQLAKLGSDELILIELQGSFHVEGDPSGQLAAQLSLDNETKPTMLIGHNLLEGKIVDLSKPLAVLRKKALHDDPMQVDGESSQEDTGRACEYDMVAVVKRKVLFSKRPMPVVNTVSVATNGSTKTE